MEMEFNSNKLDEKCLTKIQQEYKILGEFKMIESEKLGGLYVIPSYNNSLLWYGVLFVRHGIYADGIFRFNMLLSDKFPDDGFVPEIKFTTKIYHPLVCPLTGTVDLRESFPQWRSGEDHLWQLLKCVKAILQDPIEYIDLIRTSKKCVNKEALECLIHNRPIYLAKTKKCVNCSLNHIYDEPPTDDPHYIVFDTYNTTLHNPIKVRIKNGLDTMDKFSRT